MERLKVDRNTPIPLYYQLQQHFLAQIQSGKLTVGDRLPSEEEVIEQSGLSRFTVRQAFQALERDGYVERFRGKGTFVRKARLPLSVTWQLFGFPEDMERNGHDVESKVVVQRLGPCVVDDAAKHLGIPQDATVVHFDRTRIIDGMIMALDSISIRADLCDGLESLEMTNQSLFTILEEQYSIRIVRAHRTLTIERAEPMVAKLFGIMIDEPVFMLTDLAFAADDVPVYYARTYINERKTEFVFDLQRDALIANPVNGMPGKGISIGCRFNDKDKKD